MEVISSSTLLALVVALAVVAGDVEGRNLQKAGGVIDSSASSASSSVPEAGAWSRTAGGHPGARDSKVLIPPWNDVQPRGLGALTPRPLTSPHATRPVTPTASSQVATEADIASASSKTVFMDPGIVAASRDTVAKDAVPTDGCSRAILGLRNDLDLLVGSGVNASRQEAWTVGHSLTYALGQLEAKMDRQAGQSREQLEGVEDKLTSVNRLVAYLGTATLSSATTCAGQVTTLTSQMSTAMREVRQHLSGVREGMLTSTLSMQSSVAQVQADLANQTRALQRSIRDAQEALRSTASDVQTALENSLSSKVGQLREELKEIKRTTSEEIQELRRLLDDKVSKILLALTKPNDSTKADEKEEEDVSEKDARLRVVEEMLNASHASFQDFAKKADHASEDFVERLEDMKKRLEAARAGMAEKIDESSTSTKQRLTAIERLLNSSTESSRQDLDGANRGVLEMTTRLSDLTTTVEKLREDINTSTGCSTDPSVDRVTLTGDLVNRSLAPVYGEAVRSRQNLEKLNSRINALNDRVEQLAADLGEKNRTCTAKMSSHHEAMETLLNHTMSSFRNFALEASYREQSMNNTLVSMETGLVSLSTRVEEKLETLTSETTGCLQPLQDMLTTSMNSSNAFAEELMKRLAEINQRLQLLGISFENITVDLCRQTENTISTTITPAQAQSTEDVLEPLQELLNQQAAVSRLDLGDVNSTLGELVARVEDLSRTVHTLVNTSIFPSLTSPSAVDSNQAGGTDDLRGLLKKVAVTLTSLEDLHRGVVTLTSSQTLQVLAAVRATGDEILRLLPWSEGPWVRLVGPSKTRGRLEVRHGGRWGTVCDDGFGDVTARVVCRQLGLDDRRARAVMADRYGRGADPILLDDVSCPPHASTLAQCSHAGWGQHNCHHSEDVGVECG